MHPHTQTHTHTFCFPHSVCHSSLSTPPYLQPFILSLLPLCSNTKRNKALHYSSAFCLKSTIHGLLWKTSPTSYSIPRKGVINFQLFTIPWDAFVKFKSFCIERKWHFLAWNKNSTEKRYEMILKYLKKKKKKAQSSKLEKIIKKRPQVKKEKCIAFINPSSSGTRR